MSKNYDELLRIMCNEMSRDELIELREALREELKARNKQELLDQDYQYEESL